MIFLLLVLVVSYRKLREPNASPRWFLSYVGSLFAFTLSHYFAVFYVLLLSLTAVFEAHARKRQILLANCLALTALACWLGIKFLIPNMSAGGDYLRIFSFRELWNLFFNWFLLANTWDANRYHSYILPIQIFFFGLFIHGAVLLLRLNRSEPARQPSDILMYLFLLPVVLLSLGVIGYGTYVERSLLVALPFFCIVIAKGLSGITVPAVRYACFVVAILVSIGTTRLYFDRADEWTIAKPKPDWRSVAEYLDRELSCSSEKPGILELDGVGMIALEYYRPKFAFVNDDDAKENAKDPRKEQENGVGNVGLFTHARQLYDKVIPPMSLTRRGLCQGISIFIVERRRTG